jgi:hypothetical protein
MEGGRGGWEWGWVLSSKALTRDICCRSGIRREACFEPRREERRKGRKKGAGAPSNPMS